MDLRLRQTIADAKSKRVVFYGAIAKFFPHSSLDEPDLDEVLTQFERSGVQIVADLNAAPADEMPEPPDTPVSVYLDQIGYVPQIMLEEEIELAGRADDRARKRLMEAHLTVVPPIARQYAIPGIPLLDAIQQGNRALIEAVETFRTGRGYRLATYATFHIHRALQNFISTPPKNIPRIHLQ